MKGEADDRSAAAPARQPETRSLTRREFLRGGVLVAGGVSSARSFEGLRFGQAPAIAVSDADRPAVTCGVASGDVTSDTALVWSRADRPARLVVEWDTTPSFRNPHQVSGSAALPETGLTSRVTLDGLPAGERIHYRVRFQDLADLRRWSEPVGGSFVSAPIDRRPVTVAWSADCVGQGWGVNDDWGGLRIFETIRRAQPDVFLHLGDTIYADQPLEAEVKLDDGTIWRNRVTPAKSKVAETLDDYRGNYLYYLSDVHAQAFNADVSQLVTWDDHEVLNNWYRSLRVDFDKRFTEKSVALLAARASTAFREHVPLRADGNDAERVYRMRSWGPLLDIFVLDLRSYRGANTQNRQPAEGEDTRVLGARQRAWLKDALRKSKATWKIVMCSLPIGLVVPDFPDTTAHEGLANGDPGAPLGRELEIADLLAFLHDGRIRNVVWVTGDVHYCAAHHYDPARARFKRFDPFWEFVAGPMHAGTFGPNRLDDTFGPDVRFVGIPPGMKPNRGPADGLQFFGTARIDSAHQVMTVRLHNLAGDTLWSVELEPVR